MSMKYQIELFKIMEKKLFMKDCTIRQKAKSFLKVSFKFLKLNLSTFLKERLNSISNGNTAITITKTISLIA